MEPIEVVSDIHAGREYPSHSNELRSKDYPTIVTEFQFTPSSVNASYRGQYLCDDRKDVPPTVDEDGDFVVERDVGNDLHIIITIEHTLSTKVPDVGLQVWPGSLLLCDYILHNQHCFNGKTVVELGAGTGLTSILAAIFAKHVICTDIGQAVLEMCAKNATTNAHLFKTNHNDTISVNDVLRVKELNWNQIGPASTKNTLPSYFQWSEEDEQLLRSATYFIAADVIYDDDLTDAFFRVVHRLLSKPPAKTLIITLEKRLNFTLRNLAVSCPSYEHFQECLKFLLSLNDKGQKYEVEQLDINFPQCTHYNRSEYMEIWQIKSTPFTCY